ncbi:lipase family protein [Acaryochloris sp. CCMEE 5410]|uniref:lipase family protein n=1 Tax=Acaryochloris sp. CCMEE 5410 TaxID=310037 RepID=UPI0021CF88C9|nr:lipase family protein [Acaryochloris sp. CCMEE 5410]KAI9131669.1 lipase family protein [Acaryochloris sp. CCMEE 5410]
MPGQVHTGFAQTVANLANINTNASHSSSGFINEVKKRMLSNDIEKNLVITGYSKGGAIAQLAAILLTKLGIPASKIKVRTFAAPKCGDKAFADKFNEIFPNALRYEYQDDVIPHYPFNNEFRDIVVKELNPLIRRVITTIHERDDSSSEYIHAGKLQYIKTVSDHPELVHDNSELYSLRCHNLAEKVKNSFDLALIRDHGHKGFIKFFSNIEDNNANNSLNKFDISLDNFNNTFKSPSEWEKLDQ